jgi:hypothetical protein
LLCAAIVGSTAMAELVFTVDSALLSELGEKLSRALILLSSNS